MRYFRASVAAYEDVRAALDAAYGYPSIATMTQTSIPPAADLPTDADGRVYIAVDEDYCNYDLPARLLADGIAANVVEEISENAFREAATI